MSKQSPANIAASVRQRLLNRSRERREDFQLVLTRYASERLLYRLSQSRYADEFVLKGAFVFLIWSDEPYRPTRDVDFLKFGDSSVERLMAVFRDICEMKENDGISFAGDSMSAEEIRAQKDYGGVRLTLIARLEQAEIPLQIDVGFGDIVTPPSHLIDLPTILDMPAPSLHVYSRESVISEKYEAMVRLGIANSRMKDLYDIWVLSRDFDFEGPALAKAIQATFDKRATALPKKKPIVFSKDFCSNPLKQSQWKAFINRTRLKTKTDDFEGVIEKIDAFLTPPTKAIIKKDIFAQKWLAGKEWR